MDKSKTDELNELVTQYYETLKAGECVDNEFIFAYSDGYSDSYSDYSYSSKLYPVKIRNNDNR